MRFCSLVVPVGQIICSGESCDCIGSRDCLLAIDLGAYVCLLTITFFSANAAYGEIYFPFFIIHIQTQKLAASAQRRRDTKNHQTILSFNRRLAASAQLKARPIIPLTTMKTPQNVVGFKNHRCQHLMRGRPGNGPPDRNRLPSSSLHRLLVSPIGTF
jgi:hypothetical protein